MKNLLAPILLLFVTALAFGQQTSIQSSPQGNGPLLNGLSIKEVSIFHLNTQLCGTMTKNNYSCAKSGTVAIDLSGKITQYRYNGETYGTKYDCPARTIICSDCKELMVKATVVLNVNGKTQAFTETKQRFAGNSIRVNFELGNLVDANLLSIASVKLEPVPYPRYEKDLDRLADCQKNKEKAGEEETAKKKVAKIDDDFWNGGEKKTEQRKLVAISNNDFWSGKEEKKEEKKVVKEEKKDEKKEQKKEELTHYAYIQISTYRAGYCGTEGIGDHMYTTNIFRIPASAARKNGTYSNEQYKAKIRTLLRELFPQYSDNCIKSLANYEVSQYTTRLYSKMELEQRKQKSHNPKPEPWMRKGIQYHLINDFYPFGQ